MKVKKEYDKIATIEVVGTFLFMYIYWQAFSNLTKINITTFSNLLHHMGVVTFLIIFVLMISTAKQEIAHFNPIITTLLFLNKKIPRKEFILRVVCQSVALVGAIVLIFTLKRQKVVLITNNLAEEHYLINYLQLTVIKDVFVKIGEDSQVYMVASVVSFFSYLMTFLTYKRFEHKKTIFSLVLSCIYAFFIISLKNKYTGQLNILLFFPIALIEGLVSRQIFIQQVVIQITSAIVAYLIVENVLQEFTIDNNMDGALDYKEMKLKEKKKLTFEM